MTAKRLDDQAAAVIDYAHQAEQLSFLAPENKDTLSSRDGAVEAIFITPHDPVIVTASGGRLPAVSASEAAKLNVLKEKVERTETGHLHPQGSSFNEEGKTTAGSSQVQRRKDGHVRRQASPSVGGLASDQEQSGPSATLRTSNAPSDTHPLFPPLPLYGPHGFSRQIQCMIFRSVSSVLSLTFLAAVMLGAGLTSVPLAWRATCQRLAGKDPDGGRPFHEEERRRQRERAAAAKAWRRRAPRRRSFRHPNHTVEDREKQDATFEPLEGGEDRLVCDVAYYARRVGLDAEEYKVQTEDGFILDLVHIYNPKEQTPLAHHRRQHRGPDVSEPEPHHTANGCPGQAQASMPGATRRYPVLLIHGLLQSAGAYCANDDDSLAFFLCKSGYDVWLGNNRCGFKPQHALLSYSDPRMWAWNIRQVGVMDLPAFVSRVLAETGFETLGLVSHSQGTTETFVALAKDQRPELGQKISVFCALAPAVYAGPLIGKAYFKFMRVISPSIFRVVFGIHAFIPLMMTMHALLPRRLYGALGYRVFWFLFNWTDTRWERDLRNRMFQFAPGYVSAESMRWWLGRDCFARHKCILATREEVKVEEEEYEEEDGDGHEGRPSSDLSDRVRPTRVSAWYDERVPPFALWVAGSDDLVDGRKLLRRFERGREPHVRVVHSKVIPEYEHLDVIWAMDSVEKVGKEVRDVIWKTLPAKEPRGRPALDITNEERRQRRQPSQRKYWRKRQEQRHQALRADHNQDLVVSNAEKVALPATNLVPSAANGALPPMVAQEVPHLSRREWEEGGGRVPGEPNHVEDEGAVDAWHHPGPAAFDFRSDVVTRPTASMLRAIARTTLLDDVFQEDPTTTGLEEHMASLTGHEAALFVVSGTMGNQVALRCHLRQPPHSVLCDHRAHILEWEAGGVASLSGALVRGVVPRNGRYLTREDVEDDAVLGDDVHTCPTAVLSMENTLGGGIMPLSETKRIADFARDHEVKLHLDGARLWEAVSAGAGSLPDFTRLFDSVSLCFSKGLGAPVGSVLVGSRAFIKRARWIRKSIGGGLRQAGVVSAAARVAVDETFGLGPDGAGGRLRAVHERARRLGQKWEWLGGQVDGRVETNMVWLDLTSAGISERAFVQAGAQAGLRLIGPRLVVHYRQSRSGRLRTDGRRPS
ncbi:MAG: hypothetical protein M1826_005340 [Phylliscum demangeonii]|nr:MAG: hypothetical protein M1826_005340 [Phylliscum demangeonii]